MAVRGWGSTLVCSVVIVAGLGCTETSAPEALQGVDAAADAVDEIPDTIDDSTEPISDVQEVASSPDGTADAAPRVDTVDAQGDADAATQDIIKTWPPIEVGAIIVTEIMKNPEIVDDSDGEWFELFNTSGADIDLEGCVLRDAKNDLHQVSSSVVVPVGGSVVLATGSDPELNGGLPVVDYVYPHEQFALGNGPDEVILELDGQLIDSVVYGDADSGWPEGVGVSLSLSPDAYTDLANDAGDAWCDAPLVLTALAASSPGATNPDCDAVPEGLCDDGVDNDEDGQTDCDDSDCATAVECSLIGPGDLVITEIMQNPDNVSDADGEWFEITNVTDEAIDLVGLELSDHKGSTHLVTSDTPLLVAPGARVVIAAKAASEGLDPLYGWESGFTLANGSAALILSYNSIEIDAVAWDDGVTFPDPNGASMSLDPAFEDATQNDDGSHWCEAALPYGTGDLGSPGAPNATCPEPVICGDGDIGAGEDCDDGNLDPGDGCEPDCTVTQTACGDGNEDPDEGCDDGNTIPGDGCSATCVVEEPVPAGSVVITEILFNPSAVDDVVGEWFELYNPTSDPVDMTDWQIKDLGQDLHVVAGDGPVIVPAQGYFVVTRNADPELNGGVEADYVVGSDVKLANAGDTLALVYAGQEVDRVDYAVPPFPAATGESIQLDVDSLSAEANDTVDNWCTSTFATGSSWTPGAPNGSCAGPPPECGDGVTEEPEQCDDGNLDPTDGCEPDCTPTPLECGNGFLQDGEVCDDGNLDPADGCEPDCTSTPIECGNELIQLGEACDDGNLVAGDGCEPDCTVTPVLPGAIVITEIMHNPAAVSDSQGEWLEIHNAGAIALDLNGWTLRDALDDLHVITASAPLIVEPGTYAVMARTGDSANLNGVEPLYVYGSAFKLGNGEDAAILESPDGDVIDEVSYDDGATFPDPTGASFQLNAGVLDAILNDDGSQWCPSIVTMENGDLGTPGAANTDCATPPTCFDDVCAPDDGEDCRTCTPDCGPCDPCEYASAPGCGGCGCEACVCTADPTCCDLAWDVNCVELCAVSCGGPACVSDGCGESPIAGCDGCACEACVCAEFPECCSDQWSAVCTEACADCGEDCGSTGCNASALPGCDGCSCESCVCSVDSTCCDDAWTSECVETCNACSGVCISDGCQASELPTCNACSCQACVCATDPFCCESAWDADCADACGSCGQDCGSEGCTESALPGCSGCSCEVGVCSALPQCCESAWDADCVVACTALGQDCGSTGCEASGFAGCSGCECESCVCDQDPTCCDVAWGDDCVSACLECGQACVSDGCAVSTLPGCAECGCEACVCTADPICCDVAWDGACAQSCQVCGSDCGFSCGNGELDPLEACDEGPLNSDTEPDACRTNCSEPGCGDEVVDTGEGCDDGNTDGGDGCSAVCLIEASSPVAGALVITEIMVNPVGVVDAFGEWFELANVSEETIDLSGLVISNAAGTEATLAPEEQVIVDPGQFVVLGTIADPGTNGGVPVEVAYGQEFTLENGTGDTLSISYGGVLIDAVAFDNGVSFPTGSGTTLTLSALSTTAEANDDGANWCLATTAYGTAGNFGTPGASNDPCPYCGDGECGEDEDCAGCASDCGACSDGCTATETPGCAGCSCEACVCATDPSCCLGFWSSLCVDLCVEQCGGCP